MTVRVVIVGGGIVGITAALSLVEDGVAVTVLERGRVAGEASGLNAGVIGGGGWGDEPSIDDVLRMGSRDRFVDLVDNRGHDISLDRVGTLTLIRTEAEWAWARAEVDACTASGHDYELVDQSALRELEPHLDPTLLGAILDPLAARAEPVAAVEAFATEARSAGATIRIGVGVTALSAVSGGGWEVGVGQGKALGADAVIIAAGPWSAHVAAMTGIDVPIVAVRGQMWSSTAQPPRLRHVLAAAESSSAWTSEATSGLQPPNLTHRGGSRVTRHVYGCQRRNGEIVFGGDRVRTDDRHVDPAGITVNHDHVSALIPSVASTPPVRTWAGLMPFTLDGQPIIGPVTDRPGIFLAGGLASGGFGRGPMTGQLVADQVLDRDARLDLASVLPAGRVTRSR